uniref:Uncharacterized protein n=1 Tax=Rheinheimera sp. BAL341 TaxID=1708203 RepID=A0A486XWG1_9GAMM
MPWLKQVRAMGWDFTARVRGLVSVKYIKKRGKQRSTLAK